MKQSDPSVFDVAAYILRKSGDITHMKLQKLVYYSQAWSLVWDDDKLFPERIEAWVNGPVVPELFKALKSKFKVVSSDISGNADRLNSAQKETVDSVWDYYGKMTSQYLSDLTHLEDPWKDARSGLSDTERGNVEITPAAMANYYSVL